MIVSADTQVGRFVTGQGLKIIALVGLPYQYLYIPRNDNDQTWLGRNTLADSLKRCPLEGGLSKGLIRSGDSHTRQHRSSTVPSRGKVVKDPRRMRSVTIIKAERDWGAQACAQVRSCMVALYSAEY